jgi:hypothetical protein
LGWRGVKTGTLLSLQEDSSCQRFRRFQSLRTMHPSVPRLIIFSARMDTWSIHLRRPRTSCGRPTWTTRYVSLRMCSELWVTIRRLFSSRPFPTRASAPSAEGRSHLLPGQALCGARLDRLHRNRSESIPRRRQVRRRTSARCLEHHLRCLFDRHRSGFSRRYTKVYGLPNQHDIRNNLCRIEPFP